MDYIRHDLESAPAAAKATLAAAVGAYGFLPNLLAVMTEAPALLKAYRLLNGLFDETSLSPGERQVVLLATSYENNCEYCVAAHSVIAGMHRVPDDVVQAIRDGRPIADRRLEALRRFSAAIVNSRGWPAESVTRAFHDAGYTRAQALEVVLGVGMKTLANYTNHLAGTPLDEAFSGARWSMPLKPPLT